MKLIAFSLVILSPFIAGAQQKDTTGYPKYIMIQDNLGNPKQVKVAWAPQVLIIEGDSIYNISDESKLRQTIMKKNGFNIVNDPDSIQKILMSRIKAIIIINRKKGGQ